MVIAASSPRYDKCSNTGGLTICSTIDCGLSVMRHLHCLLAMYNSVWDSPCPTSVERTKCINCGLHNVWSHPCWLTLVGNSAGHCLFDVWGEMSLQHKPGLLHCARTSWCSGWDTDWTNSFCKYCVSVKSIVLKYIKWMHFRNVLLASFDFPVLLEGLHNPHNTWVSLTFHRNPHFSHVHSPCGLSYDKSTASSKASSPHSMI